MTGDAAGRPPIVCPFCGAPLTDRLGLEGSTFLVFRCLFTPRFDGAPDDEEIRRRLSTDFAGPGEAYFRGICDRLHLIVTRREGASPSPTATLGPRP